MGALAGLLFSRAGLCLVAVVALVVAGWYLHHKIDAEGYRRGLRETSAIYEKRDAEAREAADRKLAEIRASYEAKERQWQASAQSALAKLQKEKTHADQQISDLNARIAGGLRLRDPYGSRCPATSDRGSVPAASGAPAGDNGASGGELSVEVTHFLVAEAGRADQIARKLTACQALLGQR